MASRDDETFRINHVDGTFVLSGAVDELADLTPLTTAAEPLKIDLRQVTSLNSLGTRRWLGFIKIWGARAIELYGCPPVFVSLFNSVPDALGKNGRRENVLSVLLPHSCDRCDFYLEVEIVVATLVVGVRGVEVPEGRCPSCGETARLIVDPDDYFIFLTD